jgi:LuxR family transcriptional regulator, maltose regulon positive regulatory protein
MSQKANKSTPVVKSGILYSEDENNGLRIDSPEWFAWVKNGATFYFEDRGLTYTARAEKRRQGLSWYAFKKVGGKLHKRYIGRCEGLSRERLDDVANAIN